MKITALFIATLMFSAGMAPAPSSQQVAFPKDGNGLLDFCGEIVNHLDSPQAPVDDMKFYWCAGYLQATQERIGNWRMLAAMQVYAYQSKGEPAPSHMWADEDFTKTCIPEEAPIAQLARVIVKWLRDHPEKLHEPKSMLVMEALQEDFPCSAQAQPPVSPTGVKP